MSNTYIPISELKSYVDKRLRHICTASILEGTQHQDAIHLPLQALQSENGKVDELTSVIEYHGLSGLLYSLSKTYHIDFPLPVSMVIKATTVKHSQRWEAISETLRFIHTDIAKDIDFCLLKGTALATEIYAEPYHRAMSDIDIMCSPQNAQKLFDVCLQKGFINRSAEQYERSKHHHFPVISKDVGQHRIDVEIHTHALSFDLHEQLHWHDINQSFRHITIHKERYLTLGHETMLLQLCVHAFARDQVTKLSNIVDIFRYAVIFHDQIDWQDFVHNHPRILLMMRYARMLIDLPDAILPQVKAIEKTEAARISGLGEGMMPLREFNNLEMTFVQRAHVLLFPSPWWQRIFYAIEPKQSASFVQRIFKSPEVIRYLVHPCKIVSWALKKLVLPKLLKIFKHN